MYQSIFELPTQVRAALDEKDQSQWMAVYNSCDPKTRKEMESATRKAWHACENLPSSFSFRIRATMDEVDNDNEVIDVDSIAECMDSFIDFGGNVQYEHSNYTVAVVWDWDMHDFDGVKGIRVWGNVFGGDRVYDTMRKNFVKGANSMSVGGVSTKKAYQCDEKGCYIRRNVSQLMEISLCKKPTNRGAKLEWYNEEARLTKSEPGDLVLCVEEYDIHRDYTTCPILGLKKSLQDIGYHDAHATEKGVFIPMSEEEFVRSSGAMRVHDLVPRWCGDGVLLNDKDDLLERHFRKCIADGHIDSEGYLVKGIPRDVVRELYMDGLLGREEDGRYRLVPHSGR